MRLQSALLHPPPGIAVADALGEVAPLRRRSQKLGIDIVAYVLILVHATTMKLDLEDVVLWIITDGL